MTATVVATGIARVAVKTTAHLSVSVGVTERKKTSGCRCVRAVSGVDPFYAGVPCCPANIPVPLIPLKIFADIFGDFE